MLEVGLHQCNTVEEGVQSCCPLEVGIHIYYCTSGRAVQENIWFKAGSIGPSVGRANTEAKNRIVSCTTRPKECDNIFII